MKKCAQCNVRKPAAAFIGARGKEINNCVVCQKKYRGWERLSLEERAARRTPSRPAGSEDGQPRVLFVRRSGNKKLGPMPVSVTSSETCPETCALRLNGCYAEFGPSRRHWKAAATGLTWPQFCDEVRALPEGTLWRHNEAGDLPMGLMSATLGLGLIDARLLDRLVSANEGRRGFTYSHHDVCIPWNAAAIRRANAAGFTVNLSAGSMAEADELAELWCGPVTVVVPSDAPEKMRTPGGRAVIVCPAQTTGTSCYDCGLCQKVDRKAIVAFRAHGQMRRFIDHQLVQLRVGTGTVRPSHTAARLQRSRDPQVDRHLGPEM